MKKLFCIFLNGFLFYNSLVFGNSENRNLLPLGEKEAFLANTGVAEIGSSGGVYYNPGALATINENKISLSGSTYLKFSETISPFVSLESKNVDLTLDGFQAIPSSFISVWKLENNLGNVALSVLVPMASNFNGRRIFESNNYFLDMAFITKEDELLLGASYSRQLQEDLWAGVSLLAVKYNRNSHTSIVVRNKTPAGINDRSITTDYQEAEIYGFVPIIGFLVQQAPHFYWGMTFHLAYQAYSAKGTSYHFASDGQGNLSSDTSSADNSSNNSNGVNYESPLEICLGLNYEFDKNHFLLDISYQDRAEYSPSGKINDLIRLRPSLRGSLGFERSLSDKFTFLAGLAQNPSAREELSAFELGESRQNFIIYTLGFAHEAKQVKTGIALYVAKGEGTYKVPGLEGAEGRVQTDLQGLIINSSYLF